MDARLPKTFAGAAGLLILLSRVKEYFTSADVSGLPSEKTRPGLSVQE